MPSPLPTQGGNSGTFAPALAAKAALAAAAAAAAKGDSMSGNAEGRATCPSHRQNAYAAALAPVDRQQRSVGSSAGKAHKGIILRKSVEYIRHLQQFLDMQMGRIGFWKQSWSVSSSTCCIRHAGPADYGSSAGPRHVARLLQPV